MPVLRTVSSNHQLSSEREFPCSRTGSPSFRVALGLQSSPDSKLALVRNVDAGERGSGRLAEKRAVDTKAGLVGGKGIDSSRDSLDGRTGRSDSHDDVDSGGLDVRCHRRYACAAEPERNLRDLSRSGSRGCATLYIRPRIKNVQSVDDESLDGALASTRGGCLRCMHVCVRMPCLHTRILFDGGKDTRTERGATLLSRNWRRALR